ncbi:MAG: exonuclease domain-containing protein [Francisellaceae bacterium]
MIDVHQTLKMSSTTLLFYDLETSGIDKCFDQVMQFAAIRTDLAFNEIERHNILIKLNPDTIPSPDAMITHHIDIAAANQGMSEYEAILLIHEIINTAGTISIGYNTLNFDDEFLRFMFYKNLLPPYDHQYKNNCRRADLYPMAACYYLFDETVLRWPVNGDGKVSLKLEAINIENILYEGGRAHDALTDVLVCVALARRFHRHNPKMWHYLLSRFDKLEDQKLLSQCDEGLTVDDEIYKQALAISGSFGSTDGFMIPVLNLGQHWHYKNQWCFLRLDQPDLSQIRSPDELSSVWTISKKWGDLPVMLPVKQRFLEKFGNSRLDQIKINKSWLRQNPILFERLKTQTLDYKYPLVEGVDVDAALYLSGFMSPEASSLARRFHQAEGAGKAAVIPRMNEAMRQRAIRMLGRWDIELLSTVDRRYFDDYIKRVRSSCESELPIDFKGNRRLSIQKVCVRIAELRQQGNLSDSQRSLLDELHVYLSC